MRPPVAAGPMPRHSRPPRRLGESAWPKADVAAITSEIQRNDMPLMIERRGKRIRRIPADTIHYGGAEYAEKNGAKALSAPEQPGESPGFEFPEPIRIKQLERPTVHL